MPTAEPMRPEDLLSLTPPSSVEAPLVFAAGPVTDAPSNSEAEKLEGQLKTQRQRIDSKMGELAGYLVDAQTMATHRTDFYKFRVLLNSQKLDLMTLSARYSRRLAREHEEVVARYRDGGPANPMGGGPIRLQPRNDEERKICYARELSGINYLISLVDSQIKHLTSQMKGLDDMTFGFNLVKELDHYVHAYKTSH